MEKEIEKNNKNILPVNDWLIRFNVVKTLPSKQEILKEETPYLEELLTCYNTLIKCLSESKEIYGETLAHAIPLKYIYDPDWISLFQGNDVLFFRIRNKDNKIIEDLNEIRKLLKDCDISDNVYYNTLGVYYRDNVFCCLYFRYHETLKQRTKILRSYNNHKITLLYLG